MEDLEEEFIEKYIRGYVKRIKYLIQKFKEDGIKEQEIRNNISKFAELSSQAWNVYINAPDPLTLEIFSTSLAYLEATLDFLEILKDSKREGLPKRIKPELPCLPYYSIKLFSQNRP